MYVELIFFQITATKLNLPMKNQPIFFIFLQPPNSNRPVPLFSLQRSAGWHMAPTHLTKPTTMQQHHTHIHTSHITAPQPTWKSFSVFLLSIFIPCINFSNKMFNLKFYPPASEASRGVYWNQAQKFHPPVYWAPLSVCHSVTLSLCGQ